MEVLDRMPWVAKNSVFHRLAEIGEVSNLSKEERIKYDSALRHFRDTLNVMRGAEDKGRKEGRKEVARNLLALGIPVVTIMQATGLSEQEIEKLR